MQMASEEKVSELSEDSDSWSGNLLCCLGPKYSKLLCDLPQSSLSSPSTEEFAISSISSDHSKDSVKSTLSLLILILIRFPFLIIYLVLTIFFLSIHLPNNNYPHRSVSANQSGSMETWDTRRTLLSL